MKKLGFIIMIAMIVVLAGCASSSGTSTPSPAAAELPPPPPGTERLTLSNAGLAIFKFELPAGQTWGNYNKMTAEYLVDEENITKSLRSGAVRLLGNYLESNFKPDSGTKTISLGTDSMFANKIIDNNTTSWAAMGAVPNEWFSYEYNISGSRAHGQFVRSNVPAANETGPFYFALGLTSQDEGRRNAITQLIRNVTLHHATNPSLNVVSKGSGFEETASVAYYANNVVRVSGGPAQ